jgi:hypothetical protein
MKNDSDIDKAKSALGNNPDGNYFSPEIYEREEFQDPVVIECRKLIMSKGDQAMLRSFDKHIGGMNWLGPNYDVSIFDD